MGSVCTVKVVKDQKCVNCGTMDNKKITAHFSGAYYFVYPREEGRMHREIKHLNAGQVYIAPFEIIEFRFLRDCDLEEYFSIADRVFELTIKLFSEEGCL